MRHIVDVSRRKRSQRIALRDVITEGRLQRSPRSASALLNEVVAMETRRRRQGSRPALFRTTATSGPQHAPVFTVETQLHGQVYIGRGRNKAEAREMAATAALQSCVQLQDPSIIHTIHNRGLTNSFGASPDQTDFTNDVISSGSLSQSSDFVTMTNNYKPIPKSIGRHIPIDNGRQSGPSGKPFSERLPRSRLITSNATAADEHEWGKPAITEFKSPSRRESSPSTIERLSKICDGQPPRHCNSFNDHDHTTPSVHGNDVSTATSGGDDGKATKFFRESRNTRWTAVSVLADMRPTVRFHRIQDQSSALGQFSVSITVDEQQFKGVGRSARLAAEQAAEKALRRVFGLDSLVEYIRQTTYVRSARPTS